MKLVITGGHLSPLLAVLDALPSDFSVLVIGRKHALEGDKAVSLEYQALEERGIAFKEISAGRLQRKWTQYTLLSLFKFPYGFLQAFIILKEFAPDAVLSFGGYVSLPVTLACLLLGIPVVIHEQTLGAGLTNRIASIWARKVCISWESSRRFFPKQKTVFTGNPIRKFKIQNFPRSGISLRETKFKIEDKSEKIPIIYITGGSSGSHAINVLIEGCLENLLKKYKVIHQTGDARKYRDFERLQRLKESLSRRLKTRYHLVKFIKPEDIGTIFSKADLVVSRSGINTTTELLFFDKPSLLIPLPYSQDNEQLENAYFLRDAGLAEVAFQENLNSDNLFEFIASMIKNKDNYKAAQNYKDMVRVDAAERIVDILQAI